jgi:predicted nucleotidyltransferase
MEAIVAEQQERRRELCERFRVKRLELFGSAVDGPFDSETSDLDFLVEFGPMSPGDHADAYFGLLEALQDLFGRDIDLVETPAVQNPYLLAAVNESRTVIYAE